jgi:hypothetical protein
MFILQNVEEIFEKYVFFNFLGKKKDFQPTLISPPSFFVKILTESCLEVKNL